MNCELYKRWEVTSLVALRDVKKALKATVLSGEEYLDREIEMACGADLMSDVLAFTKIKTLLLTGLTNIQVVRTANITDLIAIVFVRGKLPDKEVLKAAKEMHLPILATSYTLFDACGVVYGLGVDGCSLQKPVRRNGQ